MILIGQGLGDVATEVETTNEAIQSTDEALGSFNKELDNKIPWKELKGTLKELDNFKEDYSEKSGTLVSLIKWQIEDAIESYDWASAKISKWCGTAIELLTKYVGLFENDYTVEKAHQQKELLVEMLDKGIEKMTEAQRAIDSSSTRLNEAAGSLTELHSEFAVEFDEKSTYFKSKIDTIRSATYGTTGWFLGPFGLVFSAAILEFGVIPKFKEKLNEIEQFYANLKVKIEQANGDIGTTKGKLDKELGKIRGLRAKTTATKTFVDLDDVPDLRDELIKSAQILIENCKEYRRKHAEKANN